MAKGTLPASVLELVEVNIHILAFQEIALIYLASIELLLVIVWTTLGLALPTSTVVTALFMSLHSLAAALKQCDLLIH
jgi:hypothetical protein